MALDRQKILNELGSVMNQLKNADCGCMGKLFGGGFNAGHGCHGGHAGLAGHPGHGGQFGHHPCPSEPFLPKLNLGTMNPAKLYAETFSYLNKNLMQPTIKEVYDELKGINNMNTIMNHPSGNQASGRPSPAAAIKAQMLKEAQNAQKNASPEAAPNQMGMSGRGMMDGNMNNMHPGMNMSGDGTTNMSHASNTNYNTMTQGMPMQGDIRSVYSTDPRMASADGSRMAKERVPEATSPTPVVGQKYQYSPRGIGPDILQMMYKKHGAWGSPQNDNNAGEAANPGQQVIPTQSQHAKFNQMFPGLKGIGDGGLGYDPMAVAYQMNPASKQKDAVESMIKSVNNEPTGFGSSDGQSTQVPQNRDPNMLAGGEEPMYQQYSSNQDPILAYNQQNVNPYFGNGPQGYAPEIDYNKPEIDSNQPDQAYNPIGQPIGEYRPAEPGVQETISTPYTTRQFRNDPSFYSSVRNTESKTSLMGVPGNAMGNRNQLNHLYNQYKGSHSYTHQAVTPPTFGGSMSVGRLNMPTTTQGNASQRAPIEKFGGDTAANTAPSYSKMPPVTLGGDIPAASKVQEYNSAPKESHIAAKAAASRNGLQDLKFTNYSTAPAWSFYRNSRTSPFPA